MFCGNLANATKVLNFILNEKSVPRKNNIKKILLLGHCNKNKICKDLIKIIFLYLNNIFKINVESGMYLSNDISDKNEVLIIQYRKMLVDDIKKAAPLGCKVNYGEYLVTLLYNGTNYMGQSTYTKLQKFINTNCMLNVDEHDEKYILTNINNLLVDDFKRYINFYKDQ